MLTNLELDGGRIMAEAYMIAMAAQVGRDRAHELLYQAVRRSRDSGQSLHDALRGSVSGDVWAAVSPLLPSPAQYVGQAVPVCTAALEEWSVARSGQSRPNPTPVLTGRTAAS
jgi:3-carboxy-cis,cis-muconate cycloisomerase